MTSPVKTFFKYFREFSNLFSKVFMIFAVCIVIIGLFGMAIKNQPIKLRTDAEIVSANRKEIYGTINHLKSLKDKDAKTTLMLYRMNSCIMSGEACTDNPNEGDKYFSRSLMGRVSSAITFTYANPPASGIYWAYSNLEHAGFVPKTYAADGVGLAAIRPLAAIWQIFRNISFALITLAVVVIGFLIMFRFKINPQTVVSAENSLPRLVITLILITFSFAIGGFMIDLMYILSSVLVGIVGNYEIIPGQPLMEAAKQTELVAGSSGFRLLNDIVWNYKIWQIGDAFYSFIPTFIASIIKTLANAIVIYIITRIPGINDLWTGKIGDLPDWCAGLCKTITSVIFVGAFVTFLGINAGLVLSAIIVGITALLVFIRLFFLLFTAYLRIIINILFSPLILLTGVLPGKSAFGKWIKTLAADLAVFPTVMVLLLVASIIAKLPSSESIWQPPFFQTTVNTGAFKIVLSVGILFMIPDIVRALREFMGVKGSPLKLGFATFVGGVTGAAGGLLSTTGQFGSLSHAISGLTGKNIRELVKGRGGGKGGGGGGAAHSVSEGASTVSHGTFS